MITYNRQDALLTATLAIPAGANKEVISDDVIDSGFAGSIDECQLVIECDTASPEEVSFFVMSCDTPDGIFSPSVTLSNLKVPDGELRTRLPIDCKRYLKLKAVTGVSIGLSEATQAKMTLRV